MILTGNQIIFEKRRQRIKVEPFIEEHVNTNSIDLRLGETYLVYRDEIIDPRRAPNYEIKKIPEEGLFLRQGDFVLAETYEKVGSDYFVPLLHAKSGTARSGLFVHVTADLIDIGSFGKLTLQLYATLPVRVFPLQRIAQVTFWTPKGQIKLYNGKYQHSDGPRASMTHLDFDVLDADLVTEKDEF